MEPKENQWKRMARHAVAQGLATTDSTDRATVREVLSDHYPFGARSYTPYRIWLTEVKRALDLRCGHLPTPDHIKHHWSR